MRVFDGKAATETRNMYVYMCTSSCPQIAYPDKSKFSITSNILNKQIINGRKECSKLGRGKSKHHLLLLLIVHNKAKVPQQKPFAKQKKTSMSYYNP